MLKHQQCIFAFSIQNLRWDIYFCHCFYWRVFLFETLSSSIRIRFCNHPPPTPSNWKLALLFQIGRQSPTPPPPEALLNFVFLFIHLGCLRSRRIGIGEVWALWGKEKKVCQRSLCRRRSSSSSVGRRDEGNEGSFKAGWGNWRWGRARIDDGKRQREIFSKDQGPLFWTRAKRAGLSSWVDTLHWVDILKKSRKFCEIFFFWIRRRYFKRLEKGFLCASGRWGTGSYWRRGIRELYLWFCGFCVWEAFLHR